MTANPTDHHLILIVDDVCENRELVRIYLEKLGWNTISCDSGEQALVELEHIKPDAILLDIKMPGIDGIALARVIRLTLSHADTKIVGYTAHALKDEIEFILNSGFDQVLIKPVTYKDISSCFGTTGIEFI